MPVNKKVIIYCNSLQERVAKLYKFRDEYFKTYGIEDAASKTQRVQQEVNKTIQLIDSIRGW